MKLHKLWSSQSNGRTQCKSISENWVFILQPAVEAVCDFLHVFFSVMFGWVRVVILRELNKITVVMIVIPNCVIGACWGRRTKIWIHCMWRGREQTETRGCTSVWWGESVYAHQLWKGRHKLNCQEVLSIEHVKFALRTDGKCWRGRKADVGWTTFSFQ